MNCCAMTTTGGTQFGHVDLSLPVVVRQGGGPSSLGYRSWRYYGHGMRSLALLLLVVLLAAACGDDDSGEAGSVTTTTVESPSGVPASIGGIIDGDISGDINVLGYVVIDENGTRFCSVLLESFPPQCGPPSVDLVDLDITAISLQEEDGVQWTDDVVILLGRYRDGTFTVLDVGEPQEPPAGDVSDSSSGMTVDGGLSVSEALDSEAVGATGVLAVRGHLYDEGAGAALCEILTGGGERYTCGGPLLPVEGLDLESISDAVIIHDGLTYTETEITVLGEIVDGTLVVDPTVR